MTKGLLEKGLDIILVEDDEVDVMNVRRAFKRKRIANPLIVTTSGIEALELLRNDQTSASSVSGEGNRRVVLLDLNMPRMNGLEFLQELRQDPALRRTPVVVLTTSDDDSDRRNAYRYNVAGYILKTVPFNQFADAIESLNRYWSLCEMA